MNSQVGQEVLPCPTALPLRGASREAFSTTCKLVERIIKMNKIILPITILIAILSTVIFAAETSPAPVTINLTEDVFKFFKAAVWVCGIFIALLAFIGVAFFGFDVRKAQTSIGEALTEVKKILADAKQLNSEIIQIHKELLELKNTYREKADEAENRIEELGAKIEEISEKSEIVAPVRAKEKTRETDIQSRDESTLIREVINSSSFEWTTMLRIMKKTGLTREQILNIARTMPDIKISFGRKTKDHIFKIKDNN